MVLTYFHYDADIPIFCHSLYSNKNKPNGVAQATYLFSHKDFGKGFKNGHVINYVQYLSG